MSDILARILATKKREIAQAERERPLDDIPLQHFAVVGEEGVAGRHALTASHKGILQWLRHRG